MAEVEADYEWLVSDLEEYLDTKIRRSEWDTKTATAETNLDALESQLIGMEVDLRLTENSDQPLTVALNSFYDAKVQKSDYLSRVAAEDSEFDDLESILNAMEVNLRGVETGLLNHLTQLTP